MEQLQYFQIPRWLGTWPQTIFCGPLPNQAVQLETFNYDPLKHFTNVRKQKFISQKSRGKLRADLRGRKYVGPWLNALFTMGSVLVAYYKALYFTDSAVSVNHIGAAGRLETLQLIGVKLSGTKARWRRQSLCSGGKRTLLMACPATEKRRRKERSSASSKTPRNKAARNVEAAPPASVEPRRINKRHK